MSVHYLETGSVDPCYNLALEEHILETRREEDWLLLWQNANTVVVGLNQNTAEEIDPSFVEAHGIVVVRRMTGGGAVYHDLGNLNYSFITDTGDTETLSIARFCEPVCRALASLGVQAETSGRNDILVDGKKVSGVFSCGMRQEGSFRRRKSQTNCVSDRRKCPDPARRRRFPCRSLENRGSIRDRSQDRS